MNQQRQRANQQTLPAAYANTALDEKSTMANSFTPHGPLACQEPRLQQLFHHRHQQHGQQTQPSTPKAGATMQLHSMKPASSQPNTLVAKQPKGGEQQFEQTATEQTALDIAQSAAARVTGSAAAALAAAKFKMLRSNALASAFGRPSCTEAPGLAQTAPPTTNGEPLNLLAIQTKDKRIINTLSSSSGACSRHLD